MNKRSFFHRQNWPAAIIAVALSCCGGGFAHAAQSADSAVPRLPGVRLAEGISEITGVAISPLLGVSCMGAWRYWRTSEELRDELPWYCHPYAWGFGFGLLAMVFAKDLFGTVAPPLVKKPLDVAELFEDKVSALIASVGFVPLLASEMLVSGGEGASPPPDAALSVSSDGMLASIAPPLAEISAASFLLVPLMIVLFLLVWLAGHAINVLIVLSPFGIIDSFLKLVKLGLLGLVVASAFLNPWFGLVVCIPIVVAAILIAPWAFRLSVSGTWFGFDLLRFLKAERRSAEPIDTLRSFSARGFSAKPVRTCGRLVRSETGSIEFHFRRMAVLPAAKNPIPQDGLVLVRGLWSPLILHESRDENDVEKTVALFLLSPRYRSREDDIAAKFGIGEVRDGGIAKGFKAARQWLREVLFTDRYRQVST